MDRALGLEPPDPLYADAVRFVAEAGYASVSLVQRRVVVGYCRACRLMDEMVRAGMVGDLIPGRGGQRAIVNM